MVEDAAAAAASTPAKKGATTPSEGDLSAASAPEKDEAAAGLGFGAAAAPVAFDPTFGAASSASGAADTAADTLLAELTSRGVIPSGMGSEAKVLLQGLMMQYQEV